MDNHAAEECVSVNLPEGSNGAHLAHDSILLHMPLIQDHFFLASADHEIGIVFGPSRP